MLATTRELVWGLREVSHEVRRWRSRAVAIPDAALRVDALESLTSKRASTDGAALFWTLPGGRHPNLLRLLVAFEVMADFLDSASERGVRASARGAHARTVSEVQSHRAMASGVQLHCAMASGAQSHRAMASEAQSHRAMASEAQSHRAMASEAQSHRAMASEAQSHRAMASEAQSHRAMASEAQSHRAMASEAQSHRAMASEAQSHRAMASGVQLHYATASGVQLHRALSEALDPGAPVSAYYSHHPWSADGGYLRALVAACRGRCARLPSYARVRAHAIRAATLTRVLGLNHEPDPAARDAALGEWARREARGWGELAWFESTAAASGWLTVLALLALAAGGELEERRVHDTCAAYLPWISLAGTMLDSYADQPQDAAGGEHNYIAHYPCAEEAVRRVGELVREAALRARALPDGARHGVIVGCMVAMYLSKDSARTPEMRAGTRRLARAGGTLARLLLPVLRGWRVAYALCGD